MNYVVLMNFTNVYPSSAMVVFNSLFNVYCKRSSCSHYLDVLVPDWYGANWLI